MIIFHARSSHVSLFRLGLTKVLKLDFMRAKKKKKRKKKERKKEPKKKKCFIATVLTEIKR